MRKHTEDGILLNNSTILSVSPNMMVGVVFGGLWWYSCPKGEINDFLRNIACWLFESDERSHNSVSRVECIGDITPGLDHCWPQGSRGRANGEYSGQKFMPQPGYLHSLISAPFFTVFRDTCFFYKKPFYKKLVLKMPKC